ncbi:hypothetical protein [Loktanella sp. M215]|uniref:hypothetical protein n=1 Tax=Loktanella sp. M215 TaxID=2675431 RepID=UPI001F1FC57F|nr:hypothetical protein [Loktanella sp. M215]
MGIEDHFVQQVVPQAVRIDAYLDQLQPRHKASTGLAFGLLVLLGIAMLAAGLACQADVTQQRRKPCRWCRPAATMSL